MNARTLIAALFAVGAATTAAEAHRLPCHVPYRTHGHAQYSTSIVVSGGFYQQPCFPINYSRAPFFVSPDFVTVRRPYTIGEMRSLQSGIITCGQEGAETSSRIESAVTPEVLQTIIDKGYTFDFITNPDGSQSLRVYAPEGTAPPVPAVPQTPPVPAEPTTPDSTARTAPPVPVAPVTSSEPTTPTLPDSTKADSSLALSDSLFNALGMFQEYVNRTEPPSSLSRSGTSKRTSLGNFSRHLLTVPNAWETFWKYHSEGRTDEYFERYTERRPK